MDWYERIAQRRAELGGELWANVYISDQEQTIIIAPIVYHSAPLEDLERRRPPGTTSIPLMFEARGVHLPLACPTDEIGRQALAALIAMDKREFDPWTLPFFAHRGYFHDCAPDEAVRRTYVDLRFSTVDAHWLELTKVYVDLDDSELLLRAGIRFGSEEAVVGNWLLRLCGAYRALERSHETWWRPIPEEENKGW